MSGAGSPGRSELVARYELLLDVGEAIDAAHDSAAAMQAVVDLVAERLGTLAVIVLAGQDGPSFGAWAVSDPVLAERFAAIAGGVRWHEQGPTLEVLRTGVARAVPPLDVAFLESMAVEEAQRPALRAFAGVAVAIAPLVARGEVVGALLQARRGEEFAAAELALAEDLGRRAGLALAGLRLLDDERRARRRAEEASAMLDELIASAPSGIALFDREGRYARLNARLEALNGLPEAAHLGKRPSEVLPAGGEAAEAVLDEVLATGVARSVELTVRLPAAPDVDRQFLVAWHRVQLAGEVLGAGAIVTEITEDRRREAELREQRDRLARLLEALDSLGEGVFVLRGARLEWVNHAVTTLVGRPAEELIGLESVLEVVAEEDRPAVARQLEEVLRSGEPVRLEARLQRPDGRTAWAELAGRALLADGEPRIIGVGRDIDARKAAELALGRAHRRASLFADAAPLLEASFDLHALLGSAARLLVERGVCSACAFELAEGPGWRRIATAPRRSDLDAGDAHQLPLTGGGAVLGRLLLDDVTDLPLAEELAERVAPVVANARLFAERARVARVLQESLLPPALPAVPGVAVATRYLAGAPRLDVGGDFYDLFAVGDEWLAVVGDVCGKGAEAAAMTALARHTIRTLAASDADPAALLAALDPVVAREAVEVPERFVSVVAARLAGTVLEVACAGHPPPVVLRAGGVVEEVPARGRLLGVGPGARYEAVRVAVGPGDVAVLFTDGLTEAARARTGEGWKAAAAAAREQGAEAVAGALEAWARERSGGELGDDLALLVLAF